MIIISTKALSAGGETFIDRGEVADFDFRVGDFTKDGAFHTLDLSGIVPVGVTQLELAIAVHPDFGGGQLYVGNKDYTNYPNLLRTCSGTSGYCYWAYGRVSCNAFRELQYMVAAGAYTSIELLVRGWYI